MIARVLTEEEYERTTQTLVRLAGLVFDVSRRGAISAILHERLEATGHPSVDSYLAHVESSLGLEERQQLLDAVTIQETHFFRNLPQMEALRRDVLPDLLKRNRSTGRPLTIWSAGCSTGEEPYTLAMLLVQLFEETGPFPVRIVGTDVSAAALDVARAGVYSGRTIHLAEPGAVDRWFDARPDDSFSVAQPVRDLVEFRLQNLVADEPPFGPGEVDLVVCRNVTIYFGRETTRRLVDGFHRLLTPGGYLLLGHAETLWQISDSFSLASGRRGVRLPQGGAGVARQNALGAGGCARRRPSSDCSAPGDARCAPGPWSAAEACAGARTSRGTPDQLDPLPARGPDQSARGVGCRQLRRSRDAGRPGDRDTPSARRGLHHRRPCARQPGG